MLKNSMTLEFIEQLILGVNFQWFNLNVVMHQI